MARIQGMEVSSLTTAFVVLAIAFPLLLLTERLICRWRGDPREPPYIFPSIPFFGHIRGLSREHGAYYLSVNKRRLPAFTLPLAGQKLYIVNSVELIQAIQKLPDKASFWHLTALFGVQLSDVSKQLASKLMHNPHLPDESIANTMRIISRTMRPGPGLDSMNKTMSHAIISYLDEFDKKPERTEVVDLWDWSKAAALSATTEAIYGPSNPYRDPKTAEAYWIFDRNASMFLLGFMPRFLVRQAYNARDVLFAAFENYYRASGNEKASGLVRERDDYHDEIGMTMEDTARIHVVEGIALLSNTVPTAYWMLYHILAEPGLLDAVRDHLKAISTPETRNGKTVRSLNVANLRTDPFFVPIFNETLRLHSNGLTSRMVVEDFTLNDQYFFKKGNVLLMPNDAVHFESSIWPDPDRFDTSRWTPKLQGTSNTGVFRAFGGGVSYCPGRHFAATEVMFAVVAILLRYDITAQDDTWKMPRRDTENMTPNVTAPVGGPKVKITKSADWDRDEWIFSVTSNDA